MAADRRSGAARRRASWLPRRPACRPARSARPWTLLATAEAGPLDELRRRPGRAAARADRLRLRAAAATLRRCCSRRPGGSSRSTRAWPARPTWTPGCAALFAGRLGAARGDLLEVCRAARAPPPARGAAACRRPAARRSGDAFHRRHAARGAGAAAGGERRSRPRTSPRRTPCAGAWLAQAAASILWDDDAWRVVLARQVAARPRRRCARRAAARAGRAWATAVAWRVTSRPRRR